MARARQPWHGCRGTVATGTGGSPILHCRSAEAMAGSETQRLFQKGVKASLRTRRAQEEEEVYMHVMVELDEQDDTLDDGEVEIDDDEVGSIDFA
ncbi:hypothetical protein B0H11DRAFT_2235178 [Mycena galericulata]|nr:hypothetical protein B0H11DRAFT_2235178 [Mycena galericulata]